MPTLSLFETRGRPKNAQPPTPSIYCVDFSASDIMVKEFGARLTAIYMVINNGLMTALLETKEDYEKLGAAVLKKMLDERSWLRDTVAWGKDHVNDMRVAAQAVLAGDRVTDSQLATRYAELIGVYRSYHLTQVPPWWLGADALQAELTARLAKELPPGRNIEEALRLLSPAPEYRTDHLEEEMSLFAIALAIEDESGGRLDALPENIEAMLTRHVDEFGSTAFGYNTGTTWDREYFLEKIRGLFSTGGVRARRDALEAEQITILRERQALEAKLELSEETMHLLDCLRLFGYQQDVRKTALTRCQVILIREILPEIARCLQVDQQLLYVMDYQEVVSALHGGGLTQEMRIEVSDRLQEPLVLKVAEGKIAWWTGERAQEFVRDNITVAKTEVSEITGRVANPGIVRGIARVLLSSTEIARVQVGDILVTAMTTPDFVPAMKTAAAIVTDEGGIICHAAIVSRELGKPCIIGTKIATKVLKEGDLVEVDAEKGIVRIVKRA